MILPPMPFSTSACFITLCECFLGIEPHWGLWKRLYFVKRQASPDGVYPSWRIRHLRALGGEVLRLQDHASPSRTGASDGSTSATRLLLAKRMGFHPSTLERKSRGRRSWRHTLSEEEIAETDQLMSRIVELQETVGLEVSGLQIMATFIRRRIQPLQARAHPMWEYTGVEDPTRVSKKEYSHQGSGQLEW